MKAIAILPGKPNSVHLVELPKPSVQDVIDGRGVLVKVLRVGVDGTDKEINAAEYGTAPEGCDFLVLGHENVGRVEEVGPGVVEFQSGDYVSALVRRRGCSMYDRIGMQDMTTDDAAAARVGGLHVCPQPRADAELAARCGRRCALRVAASTAPA